VVATLTVVIAVAAACCGGGIGLPLLLLSISDVVVSVSVDCWGGGDYVVAAAGSQVLTTPLMTTWGVLSLLHSYSPSKSM
jgi:hypothetical protein